MNSPVGGLHEHIDAMCATRVERWTSASGTYHLLCKKKREQKNVILLLKDKKLFCSCKLFLKASRIATICARAGIFVVLAILIFISPCSAINHPRVPVSLLRQMSSPSPAHTIPRISLSLSSPVSFSPVRSLSPRGHQTALTLSVSPTPKLAALHAAANGYLINLSLQVQLGESDKLENRRTLCIINRGQREWLGGAELDGRYWQGWVESSLKWANPN